MTTIRYKVHFGRVVKPLRKTRDWKKVKRVEKKESVPVESRDKRASAAELLALAYHVERGLIDGSIPSFEEAAAMAGVSRVRLSQIMNLLGLESAVQDDVLLGENQAAERRLRGMAKRVLWG